MNGSQGSILGGGPRDNREDIDGSGGFGPSPNGSSFLFEPPSFNPMPEPEPEPYPGQPRDIGPGGRGKKSSPEPTPMPTPIQPGVTAEDLPADAGLVTQVEKALGTDVPEWVKALSKPFDALNPMDKTRLQDLVAGKDTQTGQATDVYEENNRSKSTKPEPPETPEQPEISPLFQLDSGEGDNPRDGRMDVDGWF